jgi:hypothetical protein
METIFEKTRNYRFWKPFLKNKELSFVETIFEKQGMLKNKTLFLMLNLLKKIPEIFVGFDCI